MKTNFLLVCSLMSSAAFANDELIVTKENGGIFGYKTITETIGTGENSGQHGLYCQDPGRTRCRTNSISVVVDETLSLDYTEFEKIEELVEQALKDSNGAPGRINFNGKAIVTYSYDADKDKLVFTIYSILEAQNLNLI